MKYPFPLTLFILILTGCSLFLDGNDDEKDEIVFHTWEGIYIMDLNNNSTRKVTESGGGKLRWSPDGSKIAYSDQFGNYESWHLFAVNQDGSNRQLITLWEHQGQIEPHPDGGHAPVWSPNGDKIAFTRCINCEAGGSNSEIFIVDLDTTDGVQETRITNNPYSDNISDWSPDGQNILFQSDFALDSTYDDYGDWYTMNADGSGKQRIIKYDATFGVSWARYSPEGQRIAFIGGSNNNEIYIMNADGSNINKITENNLIEMQLSWSTDGTRLIFTAGSPSIGGHIYIINVDGTGLMQITTGEAKYFSPEWRPNFK